MGASGRTTPGPRSAPGATIPGQGAMERLLLKCRSAMVARAGGHLIRRGYLAGQASLCYSGRSNHGFWVLEESGGVQAACPQRSAEPPRVRPLFIPAWWYDTASSRNLPTRDTTAAGRIRPCGAVVCLRGTNRETHCRQSRGVQSRLIQVLCTGTWIRPRTNPDSCATGLRPRGVCEPGGVRYCPTWGVRASAVDGGGTCEEAEGMVSCPIFLGRTAYREMNS